MTRNRETGFTLVELALVILILGFITGGVVSSVSALMETRRDGVTRENLDRVVEALTGYASLNGGRLPNADADGDGRADAGQQRGFLPWRSLGLEQSLARDGWNHLMHYRVDEAYREGTTASLPDTLTGIRVEDRSRAPLTDGNPNAPVAVVVALGRNGRGDADNGDADAIYTSDAPVEGIFDDQVRWISRYALLGRLAEAVAWP